MSKTEELNKLLEDGQTVNASIRHLYTKNDMDIEDPAQLPEEDKQEFKRLISLLDANNQKIGELMKNSYL